MEEQDKRTLTVVTTDTPPKSTMRGASEVARRLIEEGVPVDKLREGFARFMDTLREIVKEGRSQVGDFALDEVTFSAEIGADGEFKLLGTGVGVTASSGVTFTLRRQSPEKK